MFKKAIYITALAMLIAWVIIAANTHTVVQMRFKNIDPAVRKDLRDSFNRILQHTNDSNTRNGRVTETNLESIINNHVSAAQDHIPELLDELVSLKGCGVICCLMVTDYFYHTSKADDKIVQAMEKHVLNDLNACRAEVDYMLAQLRDTLEADRTVMNIELADYSRTACLPLDDISRAAMESFLTEIEDVFVHVPEISLATVASESGLALSAAFIKSTITRIRTVLKAIVKRFIKQQAVAAASAAVDGPFPVGDAIAVAIEISGTTWCAIELYQAQVTLKADITQLLALNIDRFRQEIIAEGRKQANQMVNSYNAQNAVSVKKLIKKI